MEDITIIDHFNLLGHQILSNVLPPRSKDSQFINATLNQGEFRRIGQGFCGSVWTHNGTGPAIALKRANGAITRYLWKEYYFQTRTIDAMTRLGTRQPRIQIPQCHWYTNGSDSSWWIPTLSSFPAQTHPCNAMCSDLIPSLPRTMRDRLIDLYCPQNLRQEIKQSETNRDCIARLYLGRRRGGRPSRFFSLRNFPLWLDQAEEMDLPNYRYASMMAETLAMMHWEAKIDGNDVEFVLGSSPPSVRQAKMVSSDNIAKLAYNTATRNIAGLARSHHESLDREDNHWEPSLWLLDFDCCGAMTMDDAGIELAASAFYRNDPYFPRPDSELWAVFSESYVRAGQASLSGQEQDLPTRFIARLRAMQAEPLERSKDRIVMCDSPFFKAFVT